jgi:hypothetical protein
LREPTRHVHYVVPAGGLAPDGSRWIDSSRRFFLPVKALSKVFCGKFCEELRELFSADSLEIHQDGILIGCVRVLVLREGERRQEH